MLVVLIDNGHGSNTPGKQSPDKSIREYLYTREIAAAVYSRLLDIPDIKPILITPELQDIGLQTRVNRANKYCSLYHCILISIHLNASGNGQWMAARGWECYTTKGQNNSDKLANCLYDAAKLILKGHNIRTDYTDGDPDKENNWYIIKGANCPAVLTESLFMDNKQDAEYLLSAEGFNNIVALHVEGVKQYYNKYYLKNKK